MNHHRMPKTSDRVNSTQSSGNTYLTILIVLTLLTGLGFMIFEATRLALRKVIVDQSVTSLSLLRIVLAQSIDCGQTLGVTGSFGAGVNCSQSFPLRNSRGEVLGEDVQGSGFQVLGQELFGQWSFQGFCDGSSLRVRAVQISPRAPSPPPVDDIFAGSPGLCRSFFQPDACRDGFLNFGTAGEAPVCLPENTIINFRDRVAIDGSYTISLTAQHGQGASTREVDAGYCALINIEFTHTHDHGHNHYDPDPPGAIDAWNFHAGLDCKAEQRAKNRWYFFASTLGSVVPSVDVQCEFACWNYYKKEGFYP